MFRNLVLYLAVGGWGFGQSPSFIVDSWPSDHTPQGIDGVQLLDPANGLNIKQSLLVVANSGDFSLSVLSLDQDPRTKLYRLNPLTTVRNIPRPYAVAACDPALTAKVVVTSPASKAVTIIELPAGTMLGSVPLEASPHAVECDHRRRAVISLENDTLVVLDVDSLTILARIPGVPASRNWHGIAFAGRQAWVAGQDRSVITTVDLETFQRTGQVAVEAPVAIVCCHWYDQHQAYLLVTSYTTQGLVELDQTTRQPRLTLPAVSHPIDAAVSPVGVGIPSGDSLLILVSESGTPVTLTGLVGGVGVTAWYRQDPALSNDDLPVFALASPDQDKLYLVQKVPGIPRGFEITDAAFSSSFKVAPGGIATAWGNTGLSTAQQAPGTPLPSMLGGLRIRVGGTFVWTIDRWGYSPEGAVEAPLFYADPGQVNFQMPPEVEPAGLVPLEMELADGLRLHSWTTVTAHSPAVFEVPWPAVLNQDYSPNGWPSEVPGARPAARGSIVQIYATGAGRTEPPLAPGDPAPLGGPLILTKVQPSVIIGGQLAPVHFSGITPGLVGVWQINAEVPRDASPNIRRCRFSGSQFVCVDLYRLEIVTEEARSNVVWIAVE
jgi:uncharacterized protein (TIGR03437 family)